MRRRVLFVDDEVNFARVMAGELVDRGHDVETAHSAGEALERTRAVSYDVVVLDVKLPDASGLSLLGEIKSHDEDVEVILITGQGSIEDAVAAMRRGAFDYVTKPCRVAELDARIRKASERRDLRDENRGLREVLGRIEGGPGSGPVAASAGLREVLDLAATYAASDAPVLLLGESGVGKEVVAHEIHRLSGLTGPFLPIHVAALSPQLVESELFGHEKGAFTGADRRRKGLLELARGGTAFLDEIGEVDESIQVKLLRFLQSGEVRRVGGTAPETIEVRVVAATNRDLTAAVETGRFRQDLYYRLDVLSITIPPLRQRVADIRPLAESFLARQSGRRPLRLTPAAVAVLERYPWPGNVRELVNIVQRLALVAESDEIGADDVRRVVSAAAPAAPRSTGQRLEDVERDHILAVLAAAGGDKRRAAESLGIALKTLYNRLHRYGAM